MRQIVAPCGGTAVDWSNACVHGSVCQGARMPRGGGGDGDPTKGEEWTARCLSLQLKNGHTRRARAQPWQPCGACTACEAPSMPVRRWAELHGAPAPPAALLPMDIEIKGQGNAPDSQNGNGTTGQHDVALRPQPQMLACLVQAKRSACMRVGTQATPPTQHAVLLSELQLQLASGGIASMCCWTGTQCACNHV